METLTFPEMAALRAILAKLSAEGDVGVVEKGVEKGAVLGGAVVESFGGGSEDSFKSCGNGVGEGSAEDGSVTSGSSWSDQVEEELLEKQSSDRGEPLVGLSGGGVKVAVPKVVVGSQVSGTGVAAAKRVGVEDRIGKERDSCAGVVMPKDGAPVRSGVALKFGGAMDGYSDAVIKAGVDREQSFYRDHVRTARVRALKAFVEGGIGCKLPKQCLQELALATHAVASVPVEFVGGQQRVRALSAVGDAALTHVLVVHEYMKGESVSSVQALRAKKLSNSYMSAKYVAMGFMAYSVVTSGVSVETSKVGADLFEAVAGVLSLWRGVEAVRAFAFWANLLN